jgi:hypothetical protein
VEAQKKKKKKKKKKNLCVLLGRLSLKPLIFCPFPWDFKMPFAEIIQVI